jgi:hypothetical protein
MPKRDGVAAGAAGQQHRGGDRAGAGHQRNSEREGGDVAHAFLDRVLGFARLPLDAHAEHHFRRDREQQQAAGDAERRQRNRQRAQQPVADQRAAGKDRHRDQAGAQRHGAACAVRQAVGDGDEGRHQAERIDHDEQRDQGGDEELDRHNLRVAGVVWRVKSPAKRRRCVAILRPAARVSRLRINH